MTFKSWYSQKIALKSITTIIWMTRWVMWFQNLIIFGIFLAILFAFLEGHYLIEILLFILELCLARYFFKFISSPYSGIADNILLEQIDLKKYLALANVLSQKGLYSKVRNQFKENLLLIEAQVAYLIGDFEVSLNKLNRSQLDTIPPKRRANYRNMMVQLRLMCLLQQNQWEEAESLLEEIEIGKERVEALIAISKGEVASYFDTWEPQWRLEKISKSYNQGRNLLNQGKTSEAKKYFASIINENPDLFYVREAKRYVEELS